MTKTVKHTPGPWTTSIGTKGATIHVANNFNHPFGRRITYRQLCEIDGCGFMGLP